jgi:hypothetical protein
MYPTPAPPCFLETILACFTHSVIFGRLHHVPDVETLGRELEGALRQLVDHEKKVAEGVASPDMKPLRE